MESSGWLLFFGVFLFLFLFLFEGGGGVLPDRIGLDMPVQ